MRKHSSCRFILSLPSQLTLPATREEQEDVLVLEQDDAEGGGSGYPAGRSHLGARQVRSDGGGCYRTMMIDPPLYTD